MRRSLAVAVLVVLSGLPISLFAQQPAQSGSPLKRAPVKDPQAVAAINTCLLAMGGGTAIEGAKSWIVQANFKAAEGTARQDGAMVWTVAGNEFRSDFTSARGTGTIASGHGKPFRSSSTLAASQPAKNHVARALFVPSLIAPLLLKEAQDPTSSLMYLGTRTLGTKTVTVVRISLGTTATDASVTPHFWFLDQATGLPLRIEYRLPDAQNPRRFIDASMEFSNFQAIAGTLYPFQIIESIHSSPIGFVTVRSIQPNVAIPSSTFDAQARAQQ